MEENLKTHQTCSRSIGGLLLSFFSLLLFTPVHAIEITWEDRGGEAIRLGAVTATASTPSGTDNKDQGAYAQNDPSKRNYAYDLQGNLISDKSEGIASIEWTTTGKVRRITRTPQSRKPDLEFRYDALGNRVSKTVIAKPSGESATTYYVRLGSNVVFATLYS